MVTSSIQGEGKTFAAVNLAITLANTRKRVLLIGADLRNPKLQGFFSGNSKSQGLSDYLINDDLMIEDLIVNSQVNSQLDLLFSGSIPPNPFELLKLDKIGFMFHHLQEMYDFIIVDTAPSMLVGDTFLITKYSNLVLYMVRAGHTEKETLSFPMDSKHNQKLSNVCFVLNDVNLSNLGYGNKYGYGYGVDKKNFWGKSKFHKSSANGLATKSDISIIEKDFRT